MGYFELFKVEGKHNMKLYLMRHGDAKSAQEDPSRPLSSLGEAQVVKTASQLQAAGVVIPRVQHSGILRAEQTAESLFGAVMGQELLVHPNLTPNQSVPDLVLELNAMRDDLQDLLLVGHMPNLSALSSTLCMGRATPELFWFDTATLVCLMPSPYNNQLWMVDWVLKPTVLPA